MPVNILSRSFTNIVTGVVTPNYKANAGDVIACEFIIQDRIEAQCNGLQYIFDYVNNKITSSNFNFRGEGFLVGDFVDVTHYDNVGVPSATISMLVTNVGSSFIQLGSTLPTTAIDETLVIRQQSFGLLPLRKELHLFVNHKQASTLTFDQFSHIDNEATTFQAINPQTVLVGLPITMTQFGNRSGQWEVSNVIVTKVQPDGAPSPEPDQYKINFSVVQSGIYQAGLFSLTDCLNLSIGFRMFRIDNDLNTATTTFDDYLSNTGWFDEGFNDEPNLSVLDYGIAELYYNQPTTGTFKISAPSALLGMGASYIPTNTSYYWNKPISQTQLGMTQPTKSGTTGLTLNGSNPNEVSNPSWTFVINTITSVSGGFIVNYTFTPNFSTFFDNRQTDRLFRVWAKVNNVNVLVFNDQLKQAPTPDIVLTPQVLDVVDFTNEDVIASADEVGDYTIEDNLAILAIIDMDEDEVFNTFDCTIYTENSVTGETYVLQTDSFNMGSIPFSGGAYLAPQTINKNYNLASGSTKNTATLTPTALVGSSYTLNIKYPFLIRWQYWLQAVGAPVTFISNDNQDWTNYTFGDWDVYFEIAKNFGTYKAKYSALLPFVNYDSDANVTAHSIVLKRADGTTMLNVIDEVMTIVVTQTVTGAISDEFVEVTVEPFESSPRWQVATNYANANPANPLQIVSSITVGNVKTTILTLDTSKLSISSGISISSEIKALAGATPVQERHKEEFRYIKLPDSFNEEDRGIKECCEPEIKLASLSSDDIEKNDVTGIALLVGGGFDTITAKLYKNGVLKEDYSFSDMINQENGKQVFIEWKQVLSDYGVGCYSIVLDGTLSGVAYNYTYGIYQLYPYNTMTSKNQFRLRCYLDKYSSSQGINYEGSNFVDDIRYKGKFGMMQPKTKVDNLVYSDRTTRTIINENVPEYSLETNKMKPRPVNRLIDLLLLSTTIEATDYNAYSPDYIKNLPVILPMEGQGAVLEYLGATRDRVVNVTLQKKVLNDRMFKK